MTLILGFTLRDVPSAARPGFCGTDRETRHEFIGGVARPGTARISLARHGTDALEVCGMDKICGTDKILDLWTSQLQDFCPKVWVSIPRSINIGEFEGRSPS